jgi:hypothetical protein
MPSGRRLEHRWPELVVVIIASLASLATSAPVKTPDESRDAGTHAGGPELQWRTIEDDASTTLEYASGAADSFFRGEVLLNSQAVAALAPDAIGEFVATLQLEIPPESDGTRMHVSLSVPAQERADAGCADGDDPCSTAEQRDEVEVVVSSQNAARNSITLTIPLDFSACPTGHSCALPIDVGLFNRDPTPGPIKAALRMSASVPVSVWASNATITIVYKR